MAKHAITSDKLAPAVGPFSTAIELDGLIFVSGQVGIDPATRALVAGGVKTQTQQIFHNLKIILEAAGKSLDDVIRVGVYLTSIDDFSVMNALYAEQFSTPYPARTTIAVAALPLGACVEIDMIVR